MRAIIICAVLFMSLAQPVHAGKIKDGLVLTARAVKKVSKFALWTAPKYILWDHPKTTIETAEYMIYWHVWNKHR